MAVQEIKTDESYTVIVSDGEKQSTVTVTKDGIRFESEKIIMKADAFGKPPGTSSLYVS